MKIAILTSPNQWFIPYAKLLSQKIPGQPEKTYLEAVFEAVLDAEIKVKKIFSDGEFSKFKALKVDYLDIQTGNNPTKGK